MGGSINVFLILVWSKQKYLFNIAFLVESRSYLYSKTSHVIRKQCLFVTLKD